MKEYEVLFQPGVKFSGAGPSYIRRVEIAPDIRELHFGFGSTASMQLFDFNLSMQHDVFPQIETIVIEKSVGVMCIRNEMFPNVKHVISNNTGFRSGSCLIFRSHEGMTLANTFCKQPDEVIDLKGVKIIRDNAFSGCKSGNVINADSIKSIAQSAFIDYEGISALPVLPGGAHILGNILMEYQEYIPDNITAINLIVDFTGRPVTTSNIDAILKITPASIMLLTTDIIDMGMLFKILQKPTLSRFEITEDNPYFKTVDGILYTKDMKMLIRCPAGRRESVVIPDGVETIGEEAFGNCHVPEVIMPNSIHNAEKRAFYLSRIEHIRWSRNLNYLPDEMFRGCRLENFTVPANVKKIGSGVLTGITGKVILPDGVEELARDAFLFEKDAETEINIPSSVLHIGTSAIANVKRVDITARNGKIPFEIFSAIQEYGIVSNGERTETQLIIDGKTYFIPSKGIDTDKLEAYFKYYPFTPGPIFDACVSVDNKTRRFCIILTCFEEIDDNEFRDMAAKYLSKNCRAIIEHFYYNDDTDAERNLARFLFTGLSSKMMLTNLVKTADQDERFNVKAYALDALQRWNDQNNSQNKNESFNI